MASYFQNSPNLFDKRFAELRKKDPNAQTLYMYQDRCRHRNSEGLFWLPRSYITADIGMDLSETDHALLVLEEAHYINYDFENEVILDRLALKFFQPTGEKQVRGAARVFSQVPQSPLKIEFMRLAHLRAEQLYEQLVEDCPELVEASLKASPGYPMDTLSIQYRRGEVELSAKQLRDRAELELPASDFDSDSDSEASSNSRASVGAPQHSGGPR